MRTFRELEPPADDEGFASVERVPFARTPGQGRTGVFVAAAVVSRAGWEDALADGDSHAPHLVFDWRPGGEPADVDDAVAAVARVVSGPVEAAICPHPGRRADLLVPPTASGTRRSRSRAVTASIRHARSSSARARRTARSRRRWVLAA